MIEITSKREGFRRAGVAHSVAPKQYPDDAFTEEQMQQLQCESMLTVTVNSQGPGNHDESSIDSAVVNPSAIVGENANVEAVEQKTPVSSPAAQPATKDKKAKDSKK